MNLNGINSSSRMQTNTANFKVGFDNKNNSNIFAKKGEPTYTKDMDSDDDGIVTFDEFRDYCKENNLSGEEVKKLLEARQMWEMFKEMSKKREEEQEEKKEKEDIYENKNEENQESQDDKVTFDEYLEYCKENAKTAELNKVADAYALKENKEPKIRVESEA